jgi:hypothetical protein
VAICRYHQLQSPGLEPGASATSNRLIPPFSAFEETLCADVLFHCSRPCCQWQAVAMVKRVQVMFKERAAEATFKAVSDKSTAEFHDRDLYPFIYDMSGVDLAHRARPALIGKNLIGLKDQDGKFLIREMLEIAKTKGSGWFDYK